MQLKYDATINEKDNKISSNYPIYIVPIISLFIVFNENVLFLRSKILEQEQIIRNNSDIAD